MPRLRLMGAGYRGWDEGRGQPVTCRQGETIDVSADKARQLLHDFPGEWARVEGEGPGGESARPASGRRAKVTRPQREDMPAVPGDGGGGECGGAAQAEEGET